MLRSTRLTNYAFSVLEKIQNYQVQRVPLGSKPNNAIYLPIFYYFINLNLNSTKLLNSLRAGGWYAVFHKYQSNSKVTVMLSD